MQGLATGAFERALNADLATKGAPEWVHLITDGFMEGRDGRNYDLADPVGLLLAFRANAIDLPVDYEHQSDSPQAGLKGRVKAFALDRKRCSMTFAQRWTHLRPSDATR